MRSATEDFLDNVLPSVQVCADIIELLAIDFNVHWRRWRTVQNSVEDYVLAYAMREEEAGDDAFVDDVKASGVV
jgi:hypothetical protein